MQDELAVDLDLPSSASPTAATSFESMFEGVAVGGRNPSPALAVQQQRVEYPRNVNTALNSAVEMSVSSTFDHLLGCDLSVLEAWYPTSTDFQWPSLSAPSDPTPLTKELEVATGAMQQPSQRRSGGAGMRKADRGRRPEGSQRPHYAVEKRYRSTLNEKYAALARALSSEAIQRICRSKSPGWAFDADNTSKDAHEGKSRQRKTTTLSVIIETINILNICCRQEAKELEQLRSGVHAIRTSAQNLLGKSPLPTPPQHQPAL